MKDELLAHFHDVLVSGRDVKKFVANRAFDEYVSDDLLRNAVERKFEIMGEALNRIRRINPELLKQIRNCRDIISFRNILIHGYDNIDDLIVWGIIKEDLDELIEDVEKLLP